MLFVLIHTGYELSYAWNTCVEMRIIMNYRKQIKLALIALVLILCTQGKPAAAKAPKIPVVATEINGKQALDASGALQRSKKPGTKKNFQKKIFIGDSSSLTLLDDLDGYETTFQKFQSFHSQGNKSIRKYLRLLWYGGRYSNHSDPHPINVRTFLYESSNHTESQGICITTCCQHQI